MLIALKQNGVAEIVAPSRLFRGSEAEEYIVLSPYPNTVPLQIAFISPTGENSGYLPMTSVELPEQYQNLGLSAKSYVDTLAIGTNEVGDAYICICATLPSENGSIKKPSYMCQYTVEETALPELPETPTVNQYDLILQYMAEYETKINNAVEQSLNAEEAAESATEIAEEAKEQANAALINSARALLEANRKRLLDFTVNSNTGIGTKYFSDGTTATVQFPIGGGSAEEVAGTPLTSITFLASQFVDGELAISPMATGYTDNNFIVSVEEKALTNGYIQTANNVFKGTDGSILLSYNEPFDGRILLFGGGRLAANGSGSGGTYNYEDLENLPSINSTELLGNKTSAELGIYDMGVYPSTATLNKTEPSVSNTIAFGSIGFLGKPLTALKHGDFIVDKYGTVAIIDTVDLENFTATYFTWTYHEVPQDVWEAIDLARTIAEGRSRAVVYNTLEGVVSVNGGTASSSGGKLAVGDNIYIRQLNVPDLWISSVKSTYASYTYVDDNQTVLDINNGVQFGYYVFGVLETNKVEIPRDYNDLENKPSINGVELSGNKTSADLKLGQVTSNGGFQGGRNASTSGGAGGAVGYNAKTGRGGSVGEWAQSDYGGAIGWQAYTLWGGSIGREANSKYGFAGGREAKARYAADGTTEINYAIAIGYLAKAQSENAAQIGKGTNANEGTLQFRDYTVLNADGKIPTERLPEGIGGDDSAFTSLASGQPIEKIVFNPNVSVEKMTNYLSGLTYDREISGVPSVCNLVDLMGFNEDATIGYSFLHVYAIDFSKLNVIVPNTSGYGIAVCENLNENLVLKQAVFATEYNEANVTLINAIKDPNYVLNYTKAGWGDTNDYNVSTYIGAVDGDITIQSITVNNVHDNKVSAFIGRDSRFFDVIEMLDNGTELKEFTAEKTINTVQNARLIISVINNAKCIKSIGMKTFSTDNYTSCFISNSADNSNDKTITLSKIKYQASSNSIIIQHYLFGENNGSLRTFYNTMTINSSGNTFTNLGDTLYVKITYYNDVEITG